LANANIVESKCGFPEIEAQEEVGELLKLEDHEIIVGLETIDILRGWILYSIDVTRLDLGCTLRSFGDGNPLDGIEMSGPFVLKERNHCAGVFLPSFAAGLLVGLEFDELEGSGSVDD